MTKQEMEQFSHLTARADRQYSVYASVPPDDAEEISNALVAERARTGESIAAIVRRGLLELEARSENAEKEVEARRRIDHALENIRQANYNRDNSVFDEIDLIVKALTGCPTDTTVEFVGTSQEYDKFWSEVDGE